MSIEAIQKNLSHIFNLSSYQFEIPTYQRPYAWTEEQASDLINDIIAAFPYGQSDPHEYFLGSIVLIKPKAYDPHAEVVDGQQRLTSLTLLFSVLRHLLPPNMEEQKKHITKILKDEHPMKKKNIAGLTLREQDESFFEEKIRDPQGIEILISQNAGFETDSQKLLQNNAKVFIKTIKDQCPINLELSDWILHLFNSIQDFCFLVVVSTQNFDTAYRIFSTLNTRGLDLDPCDILKAEILGAIQDSQEREKYRKIWDGEESDLGRKDFNMLFTHIHRIKLKEKPRTNIISEYRERIKPIESPKQFIDEDLKPYSDKFEIINRGLFSANNKDLEKKINQLFAWLGRIDNSDWIPPAIHFLVKYPNKAEDIYTFFKALERLAASLMILRRGINERVQTYTRVLDSIDHGLYQVIEAADKAVTEVDKRNIIKILDGEVYLSSQIRKYILLRLDSELADGNFSPSFDVNQITIEHVLPQNPKEGCWDNWSKEDHQKWVHRLGNLVLLSKKKNSETQNFSFDEKKDKYFKSKTVTFPLTSRVLNTSEWTVAVVEENQEEYRKVLSQLWDLL